MSSTAGANAGAGGSTSQQANDMTRNFILGVPKEGLKPDSAEAAELHAAEAFVGDIQQEILAYDIANAQAMETYARRVWSRIPFLGRRARAALEAEAAAKKEQVLSEAQEVASAAGGGLSGLDAAKVAELAAANTAASSSYLHTQRGKTTRGGFQVERTAAVDKAVLEDLLKGKGGQSAVGAAQGVHATKPPKMNTWLFKKKNPGWTPLMQRWWVPWVCLGALVLVWTPDVWKLRTLYYLDWQYSILRQNVHKTYWRLTMKKEDYETLMADIEAQRPTTSVKATDCPF